jgi:hypothetical protein
MNLLSRRRNKFPLSKLSSLAHHPEQGKLHNVGNLLHVTTSRRGTQNLPRSRVPPMNIRWYLCLSLVGSFAF